jgi:trehalose 6-phosphate synthase
MRAFRLILPLLAVLGGLAWGASAIVDSLGRRWAEKDVTLRAQLAVRGASETLLHHWQRGDIGRLSGALEQIARDERIMGAAACARDGRLVTATDDLPPRFNCAQVAGSRGKDLAADASWTQVGYLRGGRVIVSAQPVIDVDGSSPGFLVLVHDMSYADRRESTLRRFTLLVLAVLAALAALATVLTTRFEWRRWTADLRALLHGAAPPPQFRPLMTDVRDLVARLATENGPGGTGGGPWTAQRLKQTLTRHLHGERVVIVANREPYIHERIEGGGVRVVHPASGLVTALEPVMRACSGVWVAHGSGSADRETADRFGRIAVPPGEESYQIRRVWLTSAEERGYYYGFANDGLWPLCHIAHVRPHFRHDDWAHYQHVNEKFADAVVEEVDSDDPIVLVQDYHFALAPRLIRERLPRATIITFWHIPWPNVERFGICPWHRELIEGMLGSSIIGFHTQLHCNNFLEAVDRYLEARIDREQNAVTLGGRQTMVRPYPISIEWPTQWAERSPPAEECRREVFARLGLRDDALLGVGVDRLDYTKGIQERLLAVERLLERFPSFRGRFTFAQLAAPSRTVIEAYKHLTEEVEAITARVNERFGDGHWQPIVLLREHHEPPSVFKFYRAANVCYVSSLHDGMNLVAKEFVAARDDERGVLVLSRFTGAARELTEALIVNPYDLEDASSALATALTMPPEEQAERMRAMRQLVGDLNVYRWAGRMLIDATRLRAQERRLGRWSGTPQVAEDAAS